MAKFNHNQSFNIVSKARIDTVEYVTLISGTVEIWLRYRVLSFNPIPYIFANLHTPISSYNTYHSSNRNEFIILKNEIIRLNAKIKQVKFIVARNVHERMS